MLKGQKSSIMICLGGISRKCLPEKLPEGVEYWAITTTDHNGNNAVAGGMMKRMMPEQQGITNYIDVKSVDEYSTKVEHLGGKINIAKNGCAWYGLFGCMFRYRE